MGSPNYFSGLSYINNNITNLLVIVDVAQPGKVVRTSELNILVVHFLESIICKLDQNHW